MTQAGAVLLEPLLNLFVRTHLVCSLPGLPAGDRGVYDIVDGSFEGPRLRGQVLPSGGDWVLRTAAVSRLDVRMLLKTDDGVIIPFRYAGSASRRDDAVRLEIAGHFEAPEGPYAWLNAIQAFGLGAYGVDGVRYRLFRFQ